MTPPDLTRRELLQTGAAAATSGLAVAPASAQLPIPGRAPAPLDAVPLALRVNGAERRLSVDPRTTLLDTLRETLGLMGSKKGCNQGACGACTVLVDGRRVNACLALAALHDGAEVTTIEGLAAPDGALHPMQRAFLEHDAFQCGYCTPGQILSAIACVREGRAGSPEEIREFMSGNLCRCGAYPNIAAAVEAGKREMGA